MSAATTLIEALRTRPAICPDCAHQAPPLLYDGADQEGWSWVEVVCRRCGWSAKFRPYAHSQTGEVQWMAEVSSE